jgi:hypothetical protein
MTAISAAHRERLDLLRSRSKHARSSRQRAREGLEAARAANDQDTEAVLQLTFDKAADEVELAEALENQLLRSISGMDTGSHGAIFDDPQTVETLQRLGNGSFPVGAIDLGPLSSREELVEKINSGSWGQPKMAAAGDVIVPDSARLGTYYGTVAQPRRRLSLLDLIPTSPMDGRSFEYMQEGGAFTGAAEVVEGAVKPEGDIRRRRSPPSSAARGARSSVPLRGWAIRAS